MAGSPMRTPERQAGFPVRLATAAAMLMLALALATAVPRTGLAQPETPVHFLDLDTGGHRDFIKDIAFTPDGDTLISASDDKTIRVWDWRSGITLSTIRGQIGPGNEGKIFALAVSPDGTTLATGGWYGPGTGAEPPYGDLRLFDLKSGRLTAVLEGNSLPVFDIAFSPDGGMLAAGGQDGYVYVWQRDAAEESGWRAHTRLDADSWHVDRLAFAAGGTRIAATTTDNGIRLWNLTAESPIAMPDAEPLRDTSVRALAVAPDGSRFATGNRDGLVQVWSAADGSLLHALPQQGFLVGALAFLDGDTLAVACGFPCTAGEGTTVWSLSDGAPSRVYGGHDGPVYAGAVSPDGTLLATAGGTRHEIHLWDPSTGELQHRLAGSGEPVMAVAMEPRGAGVAWGHTNPCPEAEACPDVFGVLERSLPLPTPDTSFEDPRPAGPETEGWNRAVLESGEWSLAAAAGGPENLATAVLEIRRGGTALARIENDATNGYLHGAFSFLAGTGEVVTGGNDGTLLAYARESGALAGAFTGGHTGQLQAMAEAPAASLLATGANDQTIRLWNTRTRQLVASLFADADNWIIWTPQGYYYSSPAGDALVGWHVNQGPDREARYVTARQLRQHLNSPEIVRRAIITGDAAGAARELRGTDSQLAALLSRRPPEFSIRLAQDAPPVPDGYVAIEITGASAAGADAESFSVMANDRRIDQFPTRAVSAGGEDRIIIEVPVSEGENRILVTGRNAYGYLTERSVVALAKKSGKEERKGKLYVVAIGVEQYPHLPADCNGGPCDLRYPVDDAAAFLGVLAQNTAPLFNGMEALVMVNAEALEARPEQAAEIAAIAGAGNFLEPDADNIADGIVDFLDLPGPEDTTVIFVAGHGINIDEDYYFIPTDGRKQDPDRWRRSSLVDWRDIHDSVERAKGRRFMLIDTCHAANAFNPRLEKDAADARIVVLSATAANNTAAELPQLGHGVFTYAVLEGMRGAADTTGDGVRILGLADYIYREVVRLTANRQEPFYHISQTENFLVARP